MDNLKSLTVDAVRKAALVVAEKTPQFNNMMVKELLRKWGYCATQAGVSHFMVEMSDFGNEFEVVNFNGIYRTYQVADTELGTYICRLEGFFDRVYENTKPHVAKFKYLKLHFDDYVEMKRDFGQVGTRVDLRKRMYNEIECEEI